MQENARTIDSYQSRFTVEEKAKHTVKTQFIMLQSLKYVCKKTAFKTHNFIYFNLISKLDLIYRDLQGVAYKFLFDSSVPSTGT